MALKDGRTARGKRTRRNALAYYEDRGVFELLLKWAREEYTQEGQAGLLNAMGVRTFSGSMFNHPAISRITASGQ